MISIKEGSELVMTIVGHSLVGATLAPLCIQRNFSLRAKAV